MLSGSLNKQRGSRFRGRSKQRIHHLLAGVDAWPRRMTGSDCRNMILFLARSGYLVLSDYFTIIIQMASLNSDPPSADSREIPDFIIKLYNILENSEFEDVISWSSNGFQVEIKNQKKMEDLILPIYFRHQKIESFIRQLNMYRFSKINKVGEERKHMFFKNQLFKKGGLKSLHLIKRKKKGQQDQGADRSGEFEDYKLFVKENAFKIQEDIIALKKKYPEVGAELVCIFNSIEILTGQSYNSSSNTEQSQDQLREMCMRPSLFVSNKSLLDMNTICHLDSKWSIEMGDANLTQNFLL